MLVYLPLGVVLGSGITMLVYRAVLANRERERQLTPSLPEEVLTTLNEADLSAVILDRSLTVVFANEVAVADETLTAELLSSEEFTSQAMRVLINGEAFTQEPDEEHSQDLWMRVFRLNQNFVVVLAEDRGESIRVNAMRRDFIANMSHELKTPLASLGLLAEAISQASSEPERVRTFAGRMVEQTRRLAGLSSDIIALSQAQSDVTARELVEIDVRQVVKEQISEHEPLASDRGVRLVFDDADLGSAETRTIARASSVASAVSNLLSNAIKHSREDAHVGVGLRAVDHTVQVIVSDQGAGIAEENLERVFERFYRVDDARSRELGGSGLGLSIVKHEMLSLGGDVSVWSKPGVGSTFTLTFPVIGSDHTADKLLAAPRKKKRKKTSQ